MTNAIDRIRVDHADALGAVSGIGLSGQMHGAVLLDSAGQVLRPAILWNDTRASAECLAFEAAFPESRRVTGNIAMPGFTAPKLLWVRAHEPAVFSRIGTVLLPKAYIRYRLTGEFIEEMSDASGSLWLDVAARDWSDAALAATGPLPPSRSPSGRGQRRRRQGSAPSLRLAGACTRNRSSLAAQVTMPPARWVFLPFTPATPSFRWARPASFSRRPIGAGPTPRGRSTRSATRCREPGIRWA